MTEQRPPSTETIAHYPQPGEGESVGDWLYRNAPDIGRMTFPMEAPTGNNPYTHEEIVVGLPGTIIDLKREVGMLRGDEQLKHSSQSLAELGIDYTLYDADNLCALTVVTRNKLAVSYPFVFDEYRRPVPSKDDAAYTAHSLTNKDLAGQSHVVLGEPIMYVSRHSRSEGRETVNITPAMIGIYTKGESASIEANLPTMPNPMNGLYDVIAVQQEHRKEKTKRGDGETAIESSLRRNRRVGSLATLAAIMSAERWPSSWV